MQNCVKFIMQFKFWKNIMCKQSCAIFCNNFWPFSIIKDRKNGKFWNHFCLHCLLNNVANDSHNLYGVKRLFSESPYLRICAKNTDMHIKNTHMRVKFLLSLVCFILSFTQQAYIRMRFFYARQKIKYGLGMKRVARNSQWGGLLWGPGGSAPSAREFCVFLQK